MIITISDLPEWNASKREEIAVQNCEATREQDTTDAEKIIKEAME
jgi:hypothetical protein